MGQGTDDIRKEIEDTRNSMANKISRIEDTAQGTVDDVKNTVRHRAENVQETVQQKVDELGDSAQRMAQEVQERVDVQKMVNDRPWTMLGASLLAGLVLGSLGGDDDDRYGRGGYGGNYGGYQQPYYPGAGQQMQYYPSGQSSSQSSSDDSSDANASRYNSASAYSYTPSAYQSGSQGQQKKGFLDQLMERFDVEIDALKGALMSTATGTMHSVLQDNVPQFKEEFDRARRNREKQYETGTGANETGTSANEMSGQRKMNMSDDELLQRQIQEPTITEKKDQSA